jgi:hypothetical protein
MRLPRALIGVVCVAMSGVALSQPAVSPSCEGLLVDHYRQLVQDQVLAGSPPGQSAELPQQLGAIVAQLRIVTTQYYKKLQQALESEGQVASRDEQIRQLRQQVQTLSAEVESFKHPK